ncbi:MAG: aminoglycoside/hydroxyurea antibiotic resistance kinase [Chthonomonadales bacterium]|nr:aminoglycoside/hydroxyurea antibiotic resistance kinase [Chthonomonadales bacterium]
MTTDFSEQRPELWERLPKVLTDCARRWGLTILPPYPNLSINYVAPVLRENGREAVLKVGLPNAELWAEIEALRVYDGRYSVRLLEADPEQGCMLLEQIRPGVVLTTLADEANDAQATSMMAAVMQGLWRSVPPDHHFPNVRDWAEGMQRLRTHFGGGVGPFPLGLVEEAETLFTELLASSAESVVLHGDLHHDNILSAQRVPWLAIDPKGIVGEPAYEVGAMLRNLWPDRHTILHPGKLLERRAHQLAEELHIDRARIRGWAVAQAVLSVWWGIEDDNDYSEDTIATAELLAAIKA